MSKKDGKRCFLTEEEISEIANNQPVAIYGAGILGEKTVNLFSKKPVAFFDGNSKKQGTSFKEVIVEPPEKIDFYKSKYEDLFLVICIQKYSEVDQYIENSGFKYGENCGITPVFSDFKKVEDLRNLDQNIIFSNYDQEGGLYIYNFKDSNPEKFIHGSIRGFTEKDENIFYVSQEGLFRFDFEKKTEELIYSGDDYNFCGVKYDTKKDLLVLVNTQRDEILSIDPKTKSIVNTIRLSDKEKRYGKESHHINDILVFDDHFIVSVFSISGWWRKGIFDGGLIEIDRETGELNPIPAPGAWMPHSITIYGDNLYFLDSMNGKLIKNLNETVLELPGFVRGLEFQRPYCYIGQSVHRHVSRMKGANVSIDSGIYVYDTTNNISKFVQFPDLQNIYEIRTISKENFQKIENQLGELSL